MYSLKVICTGTLDLLMLMKYQGFAVKCYDCAKHRVSNYKKYLTRVNDFNKLFTW